MIPVRSALDDETGSLISWCGGEPEVLTTRIRESTGRMRAVAVGDGDLHRDRTRGLENVLRRIAQQAEHRHAVIDTYAGLCRAGANVVVGDRHVRAGVEADLPDHVEHRRPLAQDDGIVAVEPASPVRLIGLGEDGRARGALRNHEHVVGRH
jgi:hypothetical protein